jgi:hypothetical protein
VNDNEFVCRAFIDRWKLKDNKLNKSCCLANKRQLLCLIKVTEVKASLEDFSRKTDFALNQRLDEIADQVSPFLQIPSSTLLRCILWLE